MKVREIITITGEVLEALWFLLTSPFYEPAAVKQARLEQEQKWKVMLAERTAWTEKWLDHAMIAHREGRIAEVEREVRAGNEDIPPYQLDEKLIYFFELLAHRLAEAGDRPAARAAARRAIEFYDEERLRECGGAGGHAAMMALREAADRLKPFLND